MRELVILCNNNLVLEKRVEQFAEAIKLQAQKGSQTVRTSSIARADTIQQTSRLTTPTRPK